MSAWFNEALWTCSNMILRRHLSCHVFSACRKKEQPGQVGAHTPGHATPQPDLDSDKLGIVEGRRGYQPRQTFLAFSGTQISSGNWNGNLKLIERTKQATRNQPKLQGCVHTGFPSATHLSP